MLSTQIRTFSAVTFLALSFAVHAFPDGASTPAKDEVRLRVADKSFGVALVNRTTWRLEFKSSGTFFVNTSTGFNGGGDWNAQDGQLCSKLRGSELVCNDVRVFEDVLYLKRADGEVIKYTPR